MIKRFLDIIISSFGLIFMFPIIVVLAFLVYARLGSPIFFRQLRPGKDGKIFEMIKFRTMQSAINDKGDLLPDSERITPFGNFLRNSSLDELPELWNVLKGHMSLIGPRPLLIEYLPLYSTEQARRHNARPGITGWAQVNGRNSISWEEKLKYNVVFI